MVTRPLDDVAAGAVRVYAAPGPDGYAVERVLQRGDVVDSPSVRAATGVDLRLPVDDIVGPASQSQPG